MAVNAETPVPAWQRGRVASWLVTTDHKRIGILYLATSGFFFLAGGIMALLIRTQLAEANNHFIERDSYNQLFTMHGTTMIFLVVVPILAGFAQLPGAADDRRPRHGVPASQRPLVLALPLRRHRAAALVLRERRCRAGRLDELPAELCLLRRQRPGPLDPCASYPHGRVAGGGDQLRRHDPQSAGARHELDAPAPVRLDDRGLRGPPDRRPADAVGRADAAAARPPARHRLLRRHRRRQPCALPARLLVLRPPRGLHHDPAGDGDHLRDPPRLRAQADLRLQGGRFLHGCDRVLLDARVGAPHVHGRDAGLPERLLHGRLDDRSPCRPG